MGGITAKDIEEFSKKLGEPEFMLVKRLKALEEFTQNSATVFKYGLNISTSFDIDAGDLQLFTPATFTINSGGKATALDWKEAVKAGEAKETLKKIDFENKLVAMNAAFANSGCLIKLPANTDCGTVHIKLKGTGADFSRILVIAEEGSSATIIEEITAERADYRSSVVEIIANENSNVKYGAVQKLPECRNFSYKKALVGRNASVEWLDIATGGSTTKSEVYSELEGEGARTTMFTVFFGSGTQQFDFLGKATHIGRNTESLMLASGALKDKAKAIQQSFAKITSHAYGAAAHQKAKILLLSEGAKASPIPKLEIDNNDVAATHEAAVGQIDNDKVFYMMTRGLDEKEAKRLYVEGFFEQYTGKITVEELKNDVEAIIAERMKND